MRVCLGVCESLFESVLEEECVRASESVWKCVGVYESVRERVRECLEG